MLTIENTGEDFDGLIRKINIIKEAQNSAKDEKTEAGLVNEQVNLILEKAYLANTPQKILQLLALAPSPNGFIAKLLKEMLKPFEQTPAI